MEKRRMVEQQKQEKRKNERRSRMRAVAKGVGEVKRTIKEEKEKITGGSLIVVCHIERV